MRNISVLLVVCVVLVAMAGCGFHPDPNAKPATSADTPSLTVTAAASSVRLGDAAVQFTANTEYGSASNCVWAVNGTTGGSATLGTIDATGKYTPPAPGAVVLQNPTTVTITATANGATSSKTLALLNPMPAPATATVTSSNALLVGIATTIQVTGTNFVPGAQVIFAGTAVPATVTSATQLTATVTAAAAGNVSVAVKNPEPGAATSTNNVTMAAVNPVVISGEAHKGPLQSATIEVWAVDATTGADAANGLLGSSTTNNAGQFSVTLNSLPAAGSPLRVKALPPGTYVDDTDTTQTIAYGVEMDTLIDDGSQSVSGLAITPITDLINAATVAGLNAANQQVTTSAKRGGAFGGSWGAAHASANAMIKAHWGFTSDPEYTPARTDAASVISNPEGFKVAVLNGATLTCAYKALGKASGVDPAAFIKALGIDLSDSLFDGKYLNNGVKTPVTIPGTSVLLSASAGTSDFLQCMNLYAGNNQGAIAGAVSTSGALITAMRGNISNAVYVSPLTPPNPVPAITSLSPSSATAGSGAFTLTVNGSGFLGSSVVVFNDVNKPTTYVNSTQLKATIAAADISAEGSLDVTVVNPLPAGGSAVSEIFTVLPAPAALALSSIFPTYQIAGAHDFTLTATGTGFVSGAVVQWNGSNRTTTFVNSTTLTAAIPASDIASAGAATIRVVNPNSSASGTKSLPITLVTAGVIERLSVSAAGVQASMDSRDPVITPDGRYVAFQSYATNFLTPDNTGATANVFLRDTCRGAIAACTPSITQVTVAADGGAPNCYSYAGENASLSANGRYVAFTSARFAVPRTTNLVANDTNGFNDVYLRDTCIGVATGCTPTTSLISVASDGTQANDHSGRPIMTSDGRYVFFESYSSNLAPGAISSGSIYLRDTCNGAPAGCTPTTTLVAPTPPDANYVFSPAISPDGRYLTYNKNYLSITDTCIGAGAGCSPSTTELVNENGDLINGAMGPVISADSRYVAYGYGSYPNYRMYVLDTCRGAAAGCAVTRTDISAGPDGTLGDGSILNGPWMTPDGRYVAFQSSSTNLVAGTLRGNNVFVRDTCVGATGACTPRTVQMSVGATGVQATINGILNHQSMTSDGQFVVFSGPDAYVPDDTNAKWDVFLAVVTQAAWNAPWPTLDHLQLSPTAPSVALGGQQQFTARGVMTDGTTRTLSNPVWDSSDKTVATINSSTGLATGVGPGSTDISVSASGMSVATTLTVNPVISSLSPTSVVTRSGAFTLTVNGSGFLSGATVRWNGSDRVTTFVNSTQLTAAITDTDANGGGSINITVANPGGGTSAAQTFTILTYRAIAVAPNPAGTSVGGTVQFTATGTLSDWTTRNVTATVGWESTNSAFATMDATTPGLAHGVAAGQTTINAYMPGVIGSSQLTVREAVSAAGGLVYVWPFNTANIYVFGIQGNGQLAAMPVSPVTNSGATGGDHFAADGSGNYLYTEQYKIYASQVNRTDGSLTPLAGSPFTIPGTDGNGLWAHPILPVMYAVSWDQWTHDTIYPYDISTGGLGTQGTGTAVGEYSVDRAFTPDGNFFYSITQDSSQVPYVYTLRSYVANPLTGVLTPGGTNSDVKYGIAVHPNGGHLYVGNNWNQVTDPGAVKHYSIDPSTGALTLAETISLAGQPEDMVFDQTHDLLYVAARNTSSQVAVFVFMVDPVTGNLTELHANTVDTLLNANWVDIDVAPAGGMLYLATGLTYPGDGNVLVVYSVDVATGVITEVQRLSTGALGYQPTIVVIPPPPVIGAIDTVSVANDGSAGNAAVDNSGAPSYAITPDGRFVAFKSSASNLVTGDTNGQADVFVRDTCRGAAGGCAPSTIRVSVATDGTQEAAAYAHTGLAITPGGRYVAFNSLAANLVPGDTNNQDDVFVRDTCTGAGAGCTPSTSRVSVTTDGSQPSGCYSTSPAMSADGRYIAFYSCAVLAPGAGSTAIYLRDTCAGAAACSPSTIAITPSDQTIFDRPPDITPDGRYIAYTSYAGTYPDQQWKILMYDTCHGASVGCIPATIEVSTNPDGTPNTRAASSPSLSTTGRYVAFFYNTFNGAGGSILVRDTCLGAAAGCTPSTVVADVANDGSTPSRAAENWPSISPDGRFVTFESAASNLVSGAQNSNWSVYVRDTCLMGTLAGCTPSTRRVSVGTDGSLAPPSSTTGPTGTHIITQGGRLVVFPLNHSLQPGAALGTMQLRLASTGF